MTIKDKKVLNKKPLNKSGLVHHAPAVTRAATILRLLAETQVGLGVSEIARRVGLVPSTCLHVLRALVDEDLAAFDDKKKTYRIGIGLLTLVRSATANSNFPSAVQPSLDALANKYPVTAIAVEIDGREQMVVVGLARSDAFITLHIAIGSRFPGFISASGRCFAAASGMDKAELRRRFDALRWDKAPRFEEWYQEVERTRIEGIAADYGHYVRGLTVIAAALPISRDGIHRGIAMVGFEHQLTERVLRQMRSGLLAAVQDVAIRMG